MLLLALLLAQAPPSDLQRPPEPMAIDEAPSAFACTFARALRGDKCTYEARPHAVADAQANVKLAADAAAKDCAAEAQDTAQRDQCVKLTAKAAAERCTGDGRGLADEEGRLTTAAEGCAIALQQVIRRTTGRAVEHQQPAPEAPKPAPRKTSTKTPEKT